MDELIVPSWRCWVERRGGEGAERERQTTHPEDSEAHRIHSPILLTRTHTHTPPAQLSLWAEPFPIVPPSNMRGGGGEGVDKEGGRTRGEKEKKGWVGVGGRTSRKQGAEIPCFRPTMGAGLCWEGWSTSQAGPAIKNLNETSVEAEPEGENVVLLFSHTDNLLDRKSVV